MQTEENESDLTCIECEGPVGEGDVFCRTCGRRLGEVVDDEEDEVEAVSNKFCPECGGPMPEAANFCPACGHGQGRPTAPEQVAQQAAPAQAPIPYVAHLKPYYARVFQRFEQSGDKWQWNWAAFLFGPFWYMAKGMVGRGLLFGIILVVGGEIVGDFLFFLVFPASVVFGWLGSWHYYQHLGRKKRMDKEPAG